MNNYPIHTFYNCIDEYKFPEDIDEWLECPRCKSKPKIWRFNNGQFTACKCWNNTYDHFTIRAESVMSYFKRNGSMLDYPIGAFKYNWNHYCETGEVLFDKNYYDLTGRW